MARKPPPRTGAIKKGEVRNPRGGSARVRMVRDIGRMTAEQVAEVGTLILRNNKAQLNAIASDADASVLQTWTAALIVKSIQKGDVSCYTAIMDRIVGKVKERKEFSGPDGAGIPITVSDEDKLRRIQELARDRALTGIVAADDEETPG